MSISVNLVGIGNKSGRSYFGGYIKEGEIVNITSIDNDYCYIKKTNYEGFWIERTFLNILFENVSYLNNGETFICEHCGKIISKAFYKGKDGVHYCKECFDEKYDHCLFCGKIVEKSDYISHLKIAVCDSCKLTKFRKCEYCGKLDYKENLLKFTSTILCEHCFENYYYACRICGEPVLKIEAIIYKDEYENREHPYCSDECFRKRPLYYIRQYYYKPDPIFKTIKEDNNKLFLGIELEVDKGGENQEKACDLIKILGKDFVYCKHDGSLENGFEIVTHPATIGFHLSQKQKYSDAFKYLIANGYKSHGARTCGLHIHVNKNYFGYDEENEANVAKILYVFEKFWDNFLILSRRTKEQLNHWAARYCFDTTRDFKSNLDLARRRGRYLAVNLTNSNTIEFRMFRGTLNIESFLATIQLINTICINCKNYSIEELQKMSFEEFIQNDYLELKNYMQRRLEHRREMETLARATLAS